MADSVLGKSFQQELFLTYTIPLVVKESYLRIVVV